MSPSIDLHKQILPVLFLAFLTACAGEGIQDPAGPEPLCTDEVPFRATLDCIQQFVFTPTCAFQGCHLNPGAQQGMELGEGVSYANIVGVRSAEVPTLNRVEPGDPDRSYLVLKLQGSPGIIGDQMPQGGPFLTPEEIGVIREWILNGARDD